MQIVSVIFGSLWAMARIFLLVSITLFIVATQMFLNWVDENGGNFWDVVTMPIRAFMFVGFGYLEDFLKNLQS